jgi:hypothetical protein
LVLSRRWKDIKKRLKKHTNHTRLQQADLRRPVVETQCGRKTSLTKRKAIYVHRSKLVVEIHGNSSAGRLRGEDGRCKPAKEKEDGTDLHDVADLHLGKSVKAEFAPKCSGSLASAFEPRCGGEFALQIMVRRTNGIAFRPS